MPAIALKKGKKDNVAIVKKMRDYSNEPAFKKKLANAVSFLKKYGVPKAVSKKKK